MDFLFRPLPNWIVVIAFLGGLVGAALISWYAAKEHYQRKQSQAQVNTLAGQVSELTKKVHRMELEAVQFKRIAGNRLYRESFEDVSFAALSARKRIDIAEAELKIARQLLDLSASKEN